VANLTHNVPYAILWDIGVVRDLSRLQVDWTGQVGFGGTPLLLGAAKCNGGEIERFPTLQSSSTVIMDAY
jgi:hypothetical protein